MDEAYGWLRENKIQHASTGPQTIPGWNLGAAGIRAFYFNDPDGHVLEALSFPPDKGLPKWQAKDRLFLGIDHTAIVVGDTEASLQFYRDLLGFQVAGAGENLRRRARAPEQRGWRPPAHHQSARRQRPGHRIA